MTERAAQLLGLTKRRAITPISVVGGEVAATSKFTVEVGLRSLHQTNFYLRFSARVLSTLTSTLPKSRCQAEGWKHLGNLPLADPEFYMPAGIDCILGAEVYPALIQPGLRRGKKLDPVAQRTTLGWVCIGPAATSTESYEPRSFLTTTAAIHETLQRFWELEEVTHKPPQLTPAEEECEEHFRRTHSRKLQGRYVLKLSFSKPLQLPGSLQVAKERFA